ncbi:glycerate kinase [Alteribacter populi]|uniref:glycerate kinase n=1 Tax=Alteribacter populi TaxID=2011011 RepID=UPI000BBAD3C9|nr:glycerate kinase [Alteribacter populi]
MRVLIAPDSFKGSISSVKAANTIKRAILTFNPALTTNIFPMADGGEGTVDAIILSTGGERITRTIQDPLGRSIDSSFGWIGESQTAVIETAAASGLPLLTSEELNPLKTSTFGTGQLIKEALDLGAKTIILGLGGSATVDAGVGLFQALGLNCFDEKGSFLERVGGDLQRISHIDSSTLDPRLKHVNFVVASDVTNPLLGTEGAIAVFGPQKGVTPDLLVPLEAGMTKFSTLVATHTNRQEVNTPGSGAAGGIGFLLHSLLNVTFKPGLELIVETSNLKKALPAVDLIITGEGKVDGQSLFGKVPVGLGNLAKEYGIPVVALTGSIGDGIEELEKEGISVVHSIVNSPMSLEQAMKNGEALLFEATTRLMKTLKLKKE